MASVLVQRTKEILETSIYHIIKKDQEIRSIGKHVEKWNLAYCCGYSVAQYEKILTKFCKIKKKKKK